MTKKLVSISEICELLNIKPPRAYDLARAWERSDGAYGLPCIRLGARQLRFSVEAVLEHLAKNDTAIRQYKEED